VELSTEEAEVALRRFLGALNQWQRNAHLRWRLDTYEYTGLAIRAAAIERSPDELARDWAELADAFIARESRFHKFPPDVISFPPVFEDSDQRPFVHISTDPGDLVTLEVLGAFDSQYRFIMRAIGSRWYVQDLLSPPESQERPWQPGFFV